MLLRWARLAFVYLFILVYSELTLEGGGGSLLAAGKEASARVHQGVVIRTRGAHTHQWFTLGYKRDVGRWAMNKAYNDKIIFSAGVFGANVGLLSKALGGAWRGMCGRDVLGGGPTF